MGDHDAVERLFTMAWRAHFEWINRGRMTMHSPLAMVPLLPPVKTVQISWVSMLWVIFGLIIFSVKFRKGQSVPGKAMMAIIGILLGAVILWPVAPVKITPPWSAVADVPPEQAERILTPLLRNVYRAFDQRQEGAIYDVLARSIEGDLLQRVYLQMINRSRSMRRTPLARASLI